MTSIASLNQVIKGGCSGTSIRGRPNEIVIHRGVFDEISSASFNGMVIEGDVVTTEGDQTIGGVKTFTLAPRVIEQATLPDSLATKGYVDTVARGLTWQKPVISFVDTLPSVGMSDGDRYIAMSTTQLVVEGYIYTYSAASSSWNVTIPAEGYAVYVTSDDSPKFPDQTCTYNNEWIGLGSTITHSELIGVGSMTHPALETAIAALQAGGSVADLATRLTADEGTLTAHGTRLTAAEAHVNTTTTDPHAGQDLRTSAGPTFNKVVVSSNSQTAINCAGTVYFPNRSTGIVLNPGNSMTQLTYDWNVWGDCGVWMFNERVDVNGSITYPNAAYGPSMIRLGNSEVALQVAPSAAVAPSITSISCNSGGVVIGSGGTRLSMIYETTVSFNWATYGSTSAAFNVRFVRVGNTVTATYTGVAMAVTPTMADQVWLQCQGTIPSSVLPPDNWVGTIGTYPTTASPSGGAMLRVNGASTGNVGYIVACPIPGSSAAIAWAANQLISIPAWTASWYY